MYIALTYINKIPVRYLNVTTTALSVLCNGSRTRKHSLWFMKTLIHMPSWMWLCLHSDVIAIIQYRVCPWKSPLVTANSINSLRKMKRAKANSVAGDCLFKQTLYHQITIDCVVVYYEKKTCNKILWFNEIIIVNGIIFFNKQKYIHYISNKHIFNNKYFTRFCLLVWKIQQSLKLKSNKVVKNIQQIHNLNEKKQAITITVVWIIVMGLFVTWK